MTSLEAIQPDDKTTTLKCPTLGIVSPKACGVCRIREEGKCELKPLPQPVQLKPLKQTKQDTKEKADYSPKNTAEHCEKADYSPKIFTTHPKNGKRRKNKVSTSKDSIVRSRLLAIEQETGVSGLIDGEVFHLSFDCPKPLAKLFKEATRANGDSICKVLQESASGYVTAYVFSQRNKSAFSTTISNLLKPRNTLVIENLTHNQYVQSRPRRLIRESSESEVVGEVDGVERCSVNGCSDGVVGRAVLLGNKKEYAFCACHLRERELDRINWRVATS